MTERQEIIRRLQANEITAIEATRLIDALPKPPIDDARIGAVKRLGTELKSLEKIEVAARVFNIDRDVGQALAGGDWNPCSMPMCISSITLMRDNSGSFTTHDGVKIRFPFVGDQDKHCVTLSIGQTTTMTVAGLFGNSERPVFVQFDVTLTPCPMEGIAPESPDV